MDGYPEAGYTANSVSGATIHSMHFGHSLRNFWEWLLSQPIYIQTRWRGEGKGWDFFINSPKTGVLPSLLMQFVSFSRYTILIIFSTLPSFKFFLTASPTTIIFCILYTPGIHNFFIFACLFVCFNTFVKNENGLPITF